MRFIAKTTMGRAIFAGHAERRCTGTRRRDPIWLESRAAVFLMGALGNRQFRLITTTSYPGSGYQTLGSSADERGTYVSKRAAPWRIAIKTSTNVGCLRVDHERSAAKRRLSGLSISASAFWFGLQRPCQQPQTAERAGRRFGCFRRALLVTQIAAFDGDRASDEDVIFR